jgi:urea transport system permease protein
MDTFVSNLYIGVTLASILLLVGLGLTFTFGQMGVINMAHGEFIMAGAYVPYVLQTTVFEGARGTAVLVALPVASWWRGSWGSCSSGCSCAACTGGRSTRCS